MPDKSKVTYRDGSNYVSIPVIDSSNSYCGLMRATYSTEPMSFWMKIKYRVRRFYFKMLRIIDKIYNK